VIGSWLGQLTASDGSSGSEQGRRDAVGLNWLPRYGDCECIGTGVQQTEASGFLALEVGNCGERQLGDHPVLPSHPSICSQARVSGF
jgi:hypothetical protein